MEVESLKIKSIQYIFLVYIGARFWCNLIGSCIWREYLYLQEKQDGEQDDWKQEIFLLIKKLLEQVLGEENRRYSVVQCF